MRTKNITVAGLLVTLCLLGAVLMPAELSAQDTHTKTCSGQFEATVHYGPDSGLSLVGTLTLEIDRLGRTSGNLVRDDAPDVAVVGQVNGRAIHLVFALHDDLQIVGVGAGRAAIVACRGPVGGPLSGPNSADLGDWGIVWGS